MKPRDNTVPSLIKWTGSKRQQAQIIASHMPPYRRYFEPFLGGGALLYLAATPGSVGGDVHEPLIKLWRLVQTDPNYVIANYRHQWNKLQDKGPDFFYLVRKRFNRTNDPRDLNFLLRTCVNGIVRFNNDGKFNNSFHLSRPGMRPHLFAEIVKKWHYIVQEVRFVCQDYAHTVDEATSQDFVYFDPPYAANRQRYTKDLDLTRFLNVLEALNRRRVKWALSFDGRRGKIDLRQPLPRELYKRRLLIPSGNSPVHKVLNGPLEQVHESLYLNC